MASAVVSSVTNKLAALLTQEALVLFEVKDHFEWIQEELESMQCFLKDADSKQREDVNVKNWVEQIRRVSYDAEDVIETFIYSQNALRRRRRGFAEWVARYNYKRCPSLSPVDGNILRCVVFPKEQKRRMASAVVSSFTYKLAALLTQEALVLFEVKDHFEWIQEELESMQCFLKDADSKQREDVNVKNWVEQIRRVSYDAEDVIETFIYSRNAQRRRRGFAEWVARCVCIVGELLSELITHYTVGKKIEKIKKRINDIRNRREAYGIRKIDEERREASSSIRDLEGSRRNSVMFDAPQLVGQHEEFRTVRDQLMTEEQRRRVISIFGIGGSGKTALAQNILKDVKDHFKCHALVYVSQQCNIKDILVRIIKAVAGHSPPEDMEKFDEVDLGLMLRDNYLRGKRYLVVLDDIWTTNAWDRLILKLPDDENKSRVLVTTRIKEVALHADPSGHHHEMRLLNDDESWELFMKKIFPGGDPSTACPSNPEGIGRKMLAKCGRLPLAILVLGGLLAKRDQTLNAWSRVLERVNWHLHESPEQCMAILALSYLDLPHYLKPCFLYFGLFPEDYEIYSWRLISLWIAEGFIPQKDNSIMEDIAEDYLEELVGRSMIQVAERNSNGSVKTCRIHDLLRDLSISEAKQNNFFTLHNDNGTCSSSTSVRRLVLYDNIDGYNKHINRSIATLRSILTFPDFKVVGLTKLLIPSGKLLRVFDAFRASEILIDPTKEGEFSNLRYLSISKFASTKSLSSFIGNLSNLQTLDIGSKCILPNAIWNLEELRHLRAVSCSVDGHPQLNNLKNLQSLRLQAGSWINDDLGTLNSLRELSIQGDISSYHKALSESVEKLCNLRSLFVSQVHSIPPFMPFTHHLYLYQMGLHGRIEKLPVLPPNLAELILWESTLEQDAISTLEKLQHLKSLHFWSKSYDSKKMFCSSGGFLRLETLELKDLPLEEWIVEEGAMPSLKSVDLWRMPNLKPLPEQIRVLAKWI